jgi:hypothetical protein
MKNTHFSSHFVATVAFVLVSTVILTACTPQNEMAAAPTSQTETIESIPPTANDTSSTELTRASDNSETQTLTFSPIYVTPGGEETIDILLTIANGVVTEASAQPQAKHPTSKQMQAGFEKEFSGAVVGKTLAELESIDRIGGASLTTGGFRRAIAELNQS